MESPQEQPTRTRVTVQVLESLEKNEGHLYEFLQMEIFFQAVKTRRLAKPREVYLLQSFLHSEVRGTGETWENSLA